MDNNNKYITQRWQSFQFRFNSSAEIACNQPNFNRKIFVFNRILAEFLVYAIIRLIRISAEFFPNHPNFFRLQIGGLLLTLTDLLGGVLILTNLRGRGFFKVALTLFDWEVYPGGPLHTMVFDN